MTLQRPEVESPLSLSNIVFAYPARPPLFSSLSLELKPGEWFTVVGPGGSGKSTLLKIMAGLLPAQSGNVILNGGRALRIGMTFQNSGLFDWLSCGENLELPLKEQGAFPKSQRRARVQQSLQEVGLVGIENRRVSELSGGMKKRLAIARALIMQPQLILYDDPTAGLDPVTTLAIDELLLKIQQEHGMTVVMVTSQIREAFLVSSRIGFLYGGDFLEISAPKDIKNSRQPVVHQFVGGLTTGPLSGPG